MYFVCVSVSPPASLLESSFTGLVSDDSRVLELGEVPAFTADLTHLESQRNHQFRILHRALPRRDSEMGRNDPSAYDWSQHFQYVAELQGNSTSFNAGGHHDDFSDFSHKGEHGEIFKRNSVGSYMTSYHADVLKENPIAPKQYAPFDVIIVASCLEMACADQASYERSVRALNSMLGNGGVVVHWGRIGGCYYSVGDKKFFAMTVDEDFVQSAYKKAGIEVVEKVIVTDDVDDNKNVADASSFMYLLAKKIHPS
ncbi:nicotinamide N-methyltransferase-like [Ptychodera flava]|uniref:nicotinamide N-methyltransferase-like n=1 Tax=Ptychodera flava TaxID=63121 RepID=UPI003969F29E